MKKRFSLSFLIVLLGLFFAAPDSMTATDLVFFISGNYTGGLEVGDTNYYREKDYGPIIIDDSGAITSGSVSSFGGTQAGAQYFFTPNIGISLSANFYFKKAEFGLDSSYTNHYVTVWEWENSEDAAWTSTGDIKITPINLDVVFAYQLFSKMNINITAGATYFISRLNMDTKIGYGHAEVIMFDWGGSVSWDWYILELENNHNKNFFGGNAGVDFEYKVSPQIGLFIGFQYLIAPKQTYDWTLVPKSEYPSGTDDTGYIGSPDIGTISTEVNFSHYTAGIGIKVHLGKKQ